MWKGYEESEVRESETSDDADVVVVVTSVPVATDSRNPNMEAVELWYGMVNKVFSVMCNVIF